MGKENSGRHAYLGRRYGPANGKNTHHPRRCREYNITISRKKLELDSKTNFAGHIISADGIRDVERSRGLGDVYKRQSISSAQISVSSTIFFAHGMPLMRTFDWQHHSSEEAFNPMGAWRYLNFPRGSRKVVIFELASSSPCLLYTSDAADE